MTFRSPLSLKTAGQHCRESHVDQMLIRCSARRFTRKNMICMTKDVMQIVEATALLDYGSSHHFRNV